MGVSFASNVSALSAQRSLNKTNISLGKTFERLSSGLRINSASDDPAGLALADSLRSDANLASVAIRNANDGISITSIADSALAEVGNILSRMAELAEQSANGVFTNVQRSALSSEFVALASEIERIAVTTEFNDVGLLSDSSSIALQVGLDGTSNSRITINGVLGTLESLGLAGTGSSALTYSINDSTTAFAQSASLAALDAVNAAISTLSSTRGTLGAAESRLNSAVSSLQVARENFVAAESRVRDADVAQEVADLVRLQVLQQAGTAVLAQANQQPQIALALLQ
ncbi:MAG: flagellin FliC [Bdellovibrionales bacterium]|nr:flagellin FliC [Bdellovibrionales bacterium]